MPSLPDTPTADARPPVAMRVGTSGYSFPDWAGPFYPLKINPTRMLPFYAAHFNTVEINYTFYHMPAARTMAGMVQKTPVSFQFFVKAHHAFTHARDLSNTAAFLAGLDPMRDAGKLAGLLFQFPQAFKNTGFHRHFLARIARQFHGLVVAVEFRDCSWAQDGVFHFLEDHGLALVAVDEPPLRSLFPRLPVATSDVGYVRFHSRNGANWYAPAGDRYDYCYSNAELREWLPLFQVIARRARQLFVFFNNCHRGQAARNAQSLQALLQPTGVSGQLGGGSLPACPAGTEISRPHDPPRRIMGTPPRTPLVTDNPLPTGEYTG